MCWKNSFPKRTFNKTYVFNNNKIKKTYNINKQDHVYLEMIYILWALFTESLLTCHSRKIDVNKINIGWILRQYPDVAHSASLLLSYWATEPLLILLVSLCYY